MLPLAGCQQDGATPSEAPFPRLQAVEAREADGMLTAVTLLDRDARGNLVRVRHYVGAGEDGTWRTDDDALQSWSRCQVTRGAPSLLDPLLELKDQPWLSGRFQVRSCALEEQASRIQEQGFSHAGPDGRWFTGDDLTDGSLLLERTTDGHRRTFTPPPAAPCGLNCEGLNNIIYDPYAGLEMVNNATYGQEGGVRLLQMGNTTFRYEFDVQGRLRQKTTLAAPGAMPESGNAVLDLFLLGMTQTWDRFEYQDDGSVLVSHVALFHEEVFASIQASPTGQILLAILGYTETPLEIDGETYYQVTSDRYRLVADAGRVQQLALLAGPGADARWGSADDELGSRLVYLYDTP